MPQEIKQNPSIETISTDNAPVAADGKTRILILTPLYKTVGRKNLANMTEAVHYLVRNWVKDENVEVRVVYTYLNPARNVTLLLKRGEMHNLLHDADYVVDGVPVHLTEIQQLPARMNFTKRQNAKILKAIDAVTTQQNWKPDVIVAHTPVRYFGVLDALKWNIPTIGVLHSTDIAYSKKHRAFIGELSQYYDITCSRSNAIREEAKELGIANVSDFIVNSGVPQLKNKRKQPVSVSGKRTVQILYVGSLIERKHLDYVIRAMADLRDDFNCVLIAIGKGPEKESCMRIIYDNDLTSKVQMVDSVPRETVYEFMANSDVFIMPSVRETLGLVYLEAMTQGCITIGTAGEGIDGIIRDGENGFLVQPNSQESVTDTLRKVLTLSEVDAASISANAIKTGAYFDEEDMSENYLEFVKAATTRQVSQ